MPFLRTSTFVASLACVTLFAGFLSVAGLTIPALAQDDDSPPVVEDAAEEAGQDATPDDASDSQAVQSSDEVTSDASADQESEQPAEDAAADAEASSEEVVGEATGDDETVGEAEEQTPTSAETYGMKPTETKQEFPLQPADNSSPKATLKSFINACNRVYDHIQIMGPGRRPAERQHVLADVDRIMRCLDLSDTPEYLRESVGREAAVCLKEVLDRIDLPLEYQIPDASHLKDETTGEPLKFWRIPTTDVVLARVVEGPRQGEYLFSPDTVRRAKRFYERAKHLPYHKGDPPVSPGLYEWFLSEPGSAWLSNLVHRLPAWMRIRTAGQAIWQWIGLFLISLAGLIVMLTAYRMGRLKTTGLRAANVIKYCITLLFPIAAMLVPIYVEKFAAEQLVLSGTTLAIVKFASGIVFLIAVVVVIMSAGNRICEVIISSPKIHPQGLDAQLVRIVSRVVSLITAVIVFLEGGQYLGIPLTTLLAGAGVGGVAVALSAQDTLKNIFGSVMIILDKPYRIGERIVIKGYDGVVEEIGLRSTKIRLLTGHLTSIPNDEMARSDIENIGRRPHIRRIADIKIPLDTTPEKAEEAVEIVRGVLADHEGMEEDYPPRVYLSEFDRDALNIRIIYWYHPANYWDYMQMTEATNLRIMHDLTAAGISFALPASTIQVTREDGSVVKPEKS